jgi:plasmid stability protein
MATITLRRMPDHLHAVLKNEAEANYRSLAEEVMARLERSLDLDRATRRDQRWVDEALASGPEQPFSNEEFAAALKQGLQKAKRKTA